MNDLLPTWVEITLSVLSWIAVTVAVFLNRHKWIIALSTLQAVTYGFYREWFLMSLFIVLAAAAVGGHVRRKACRTGGRRRVLQR